MGKIIGRLAAIAVFLFAQAGFASAAEIKVFATVGVKSVLEEIIPKFEKATGNKVAITWSTAALLTKRVQAGEQADALILIKGNIETLQKEGKIMPGTDVIFTKSIFAVGIKAGAPKPDISTPEAFKKALLASKAVSYTNPATGGASGVYTAKQIEKMGIAEQMKGKTKHPPSGGFSGAFWWTVRPTSRSIPNPSCCRSPVSKWSDRCRAIWPSPSPMTPACRPARRRRMRRRRW